MILKIHKKQENTVLVRIWSLNRVNYQTLLLKFLKRLVGKGNRVPECIPVVQRRITASKNETPPLKKKRKGNEESDIMTKLGSTFDNFSSYMETKSTSKASKINLEHESTLNFLKSMGNDLLQIKNKKNRFEAEMSIMKIVKKSCL